MPPTPSAVEPAHTEPVWDPSAILRHVAHELRQPLSAMEAIAYYLDIVLPEGEVKARQQVGKLQALVDQANGILSDATRMMRDPVPRIEPNDLNELLSTYIADSAIREHIDVDFDAAEDLPRAAFDPSQIRHLLGNLLRLVRRGAESSQPIHLSTRSWGSVVVLEMHADMRQCAAVELEQLLSGADSHSSSGSGLAAAGIMRIAASHRAIVEARAETSGSIVVTLALPVAIE